MQSHIYLLQVTRTYAFNVCVPSRSHYSFKGGMSTNDDKKQQPVPLLKWSHSYTLLTDLTRGDGGIQCMLQHFVHRCLESLIIVRFLQLFDIGFY